MKFQTASWIAALLLAVFTAPSWMPVHAEPQRPQTAPDPAAERGAQLLAEVDTVCQSTQILTADLLFTEDDLPGGPTLGHAGAANHVTKAMRLSGLHLVTPGLFTLKKPNTLQIEWRGPHPKKIDGGNANRMMINGEVHDGGPWPEARSSMSDAMISAFFNQWMPRQKGYFYFASGRFTETQTERGVVYDIVETAQNSRVKYGAEPYQNRHETFTRWIGPDKIIHRLVCTVKEDGRTDRYQIDFSPKREVEGMPSAP